MTKRETIAAAKKEVRDLDAGCLRLGRLLVQISENRWFDPHLNMKGWVEVELRFSYRRAKYLMQVASVADSLRIPAEVVERVGWWKFVLMAPMLTPNWREELAAVEGVSSTKLEHRLRGTVTTKGFAISNQRSLAEIDRALGAAKAMFGAKTETEALLAICKLFLLGT